jgi:hypothetical protein
MGWASTERARALTESARALTVSAPLLMQPEDGGFQAAASLIPASGNQPWPPAALGPAATPGGPDPLAPRHRARQTRLSSVTAVARLVGYLAPRPRPQRPGRSPTVCIVLVIARVLFCVTVRPFVFVRVLAHPTHLLTVLRPPLIAPCVPDPVSPARSTVSHSSSPPGQHGH